MSLSTIRRTLLVLVACFGVATTAHAQRDVTLRLNAASIPDTVNAESFFEVRGCIVDACTDNMATLPDGNVIAWDDRSTLEPTHAGGDYWDITFQIPDEQALEFKFWSEDANEVGIGGGWEQSAGNWMIPAGTSDTTLTFHFYSHQGESEYAWRPWEQKEDSIAVWYRVFMTTEQALNKGFDPTDDSMEPGLRGDPLGEAGPLDWESTDVILTKEGDNPNLPGYHLYSGVAYYPESAAGQMQEYKFHINGLGDGGWEDSPNRTFTIPASDTTLHWVYYGNSPALTTDTRVDAFTVFTVDVSPLEAAGLFDPARGDSIQIRGEFNGWGDGDFDRSRLFPDIFNPALWQNEMSILNVPQSTVLYKYYVSQNEGFLEGDAQYEEPLDFGGANRQFTFTGEDLNLGTDYFNNIRAGNVIPEGTSVDVTFRADMSTATDFAIAFDPTTDSVRVSFEDGIWEALQAQAKGIEDNTDPAIQFAYLSDEDGDLIYEGTYTVQGPTYNGIGYRLQYGNATDGWNDEFGDRPGEPGRRRYQYVLPNGDGSFAAAQALPVVPVQDFFPLPFECNPTLTDEDLAALPESVTSVCYEAGTSPVLLDVDVVDTELPGTLTLSQNFPNPFNPTTTFEYAVTRSEHVTVRVFDVTGRVVATLVDNVQAPSTYRVTFDASGLASGVYLYQLQTPSQTIAKKMLLMK